VIVPAPYGSLRRRLGVATAGVLLTAMFELLRTGNLPIAITTAPTTTPSTEFVADSSVGTGQDPATGLVAFANSTRRPGTVGTHRATPAHTSARGKGQPVRVSAARSADSSGDIATSIRAPTPGRYAYRWTVNGTEEDGRIVVAATDIPNQETETTFGSNGSDQVDTVDWSGGGRAIPRSRFPNGSVCGWSPALLSLRPSLQTGATWTATSDCRLPQSDGSSITIEQDEQVKVDGPTHTTVSGREVAAWVIERHKLLTERSSAASLTSETQSTELFAPSVGLVVYRVARTASPNPDGSTTMTTVIAELRNLTPT
jgi:hypothetical protein